MREILFRGKRIDNGEWVEGHYGEYMLMSGESISGISIPKKEAVCGSICYDVEASTVGQFTGLTDKNGKKIFEGNILKIHYTTELFGETFSTQYNALVMFEDGCNVAKGILDGAELVNVLSAFSNDEVEVIGNIHDNPELLEVTK